ncbi:MAG: hypothetical protein ACI841_004969, partial [Planctomycetota bacterium]
MSQADEVPAFSFWERGGLFNEGKKVKLRLEIRTDGDTVFRTREWHVPGQSSAAHRQHNKWNINFLDADGGGAIKLRDLTKLDGEYDAIVFRDDLHRVCFNSDVRSKAIWQDSVAGELCVLQALSCEWGAQDDRNCRSSEERTALIGHMIMKRLALFTIDWLAGEQG